MQANALDRVREDLATINAAMGRELPFGTGDVRFYTALAATSGLFAISHTLGAQHGWQLLFAGLPVMLTFMAYLAYLARNSHHRASVELTRRKEYRKTLQILLPIVLAALVGRFWAARAGMSHLQFGGAILVVTGIIFATIGAYGPRPARYPRSYWFACAMPLIVCGLWIPFCTHSQALFAVSCMGAALFGTVGAVMQYHVRRQSARTSDGAD
jgi:hypothetical protein